jgi:hypothetical protein
MARQIMPAAQIIADLFVAIEQDDPLATLEAAQALADRVGSQAAAAITRALLADHRRPTAPETFAPGLSDAGFPLVSCA